MAHVHIILSGIISLIPQPAQSAKPDRWVVRLQEALQEHHMGTVLVETPNVSSTLSTVHNRSYDKGKTLLSAWFLGQGDITIHSTIASGSIAEPWPLPGVLAIADGCRTRDCALAKEAYPALDLTIRHGKLGAVTNEPGKWAFQPSVVSQKTIAEEVCWSFDIEEDELELTLPSSEGGSFRLKVRPPAANQDIELRLQNLMLGDAFPTKGLGNSKDDHVMIFFAQSVDPPSAMPYLDKKSNIDGPAPSGAHAHRLANAEIAKKKPDAILPAGLRVNCPPGQWSGMQ